MQKMLLLIFIFCSSSGYSQSDWKTFNSDLTEIKLPLKIDSNTVPENVIISRNDAMNFLIMPATKLNIEKAYNLQFPVDTSLINAYSQWANMDLNKKDTIDIYSPVGGGLIYCNGKINMTDSLDGILWLYYRNMGKVQGFMYTRGIEDWLFIYDKKGLCRDFIKIAYNQFGGGFPCNWVDYMRCKITKRKKKNLELLFSQTDIVPANEDSLFVENCAKKKISQIRKFVMMRDGKFKKK